MNLECLNDIIEDRLAIHIDISDQNSWNLNTGFTSVSLNKWIGAKSDNINLLDYGLTQYDNGATDLIYDNFDLTPQDLKLTLKRVGYNNITDAFFNSGGTQYDLYPISAVTTGSTVGNYFDLFGGYLQGFYKLQDYNFEQLPARFDEGITIETLIRIDPDSEGIFYLMGARAEDKYNPFFSGETQQIVVSATTSLATGVVGQTNEVTVTTTGFSGVTTSEEKYLHAFIDTDVRKPAFIEPEDQFITVPVEQPQNNIKENVIAFSLQQDKRISIIRIDENGIVTTTTSKNKVPLSVSGWTMITMVFEPDEIIGDPELLECLPARNGTLRFFANGRQIWKIKDYKEFFFRGFRNDREKQIGVPYNISWGGGSFGLKHSWHYDIENYTLYDGNNTTYINTNFEWKEYPLKNDPCGDILDITNPDVGGIVFSGDSETFALPDDCNPNTTSPITAFRVDYTGTTAQTVGSQYYIEFTGLTNVLSNRDYDVSVDFYDAGIIRYGGKGGAKLVVYGTEDVEILEEVTYSGGSVNEWINLSMKFKVKDNTDLQGVYIGLLINSNISLADDFVFFVDNWKYKASDILAQDKRKENLLVQQNFDSSFIGGIQKLRIYDVAFDNQMVLHNARIESNKQDYGFIVTGGGRIIYR